MDTAHTAGSNDFSLVNGGPLYRLMLRIGLADQAHPFLEIRAIILAAISWLPLLIISTLNGYALGGPVRIPFLMDFAAYTRLLIAIPIFVLSEALIDSQIRHIVYNFTASGLIRSEDKSAFDSIVESAKKLRDSVIAEVILLGIAYAVITTRVGFYLPQVSTWYHLANTPPRNLTTAGWWYALVSIPLFQFLMYRWLWRVVIWTTFLWRVSRLQLQLMPVHPDLAGGLGFLETGQLAFGTGVFAFSAVFSAIIGNNVAYLGATVKGYDSTFIEFIVLMVCLAIAPLIVFTPDLLKTKIRGVFEYGVLGSTYTQLFNKKWIKVEGSKGESILGSGDIQSLADLANSVDIIRKMKIVPVSPRTILYIAAMAFVPMIPLILTELPLKELLMRLLRIVG